MTDRHREKPVSLRLGADRQRLEDYAREHDQPVRRVIAEAVRRFLDQAAEQEDRAAGPAPTGRAALQDALEGMEEMLPYVPDYFRQKWDLDAYVERAKKAMADAC